MISPVRTTDETLVKIREATPVPRSRDPGFYEYWTRDAAPNIPVEEVCEVWEGRHGGADGEPPAEDGGIE